MKSTVEEEAGTERTGCDWQKLLHACAGSSAEGLAALYDAVSGDLHALALWLTRSPEDAADVVADVFVTVAQQGDAVCRVRRARSWLLTVTRRRALDVLRARKRGAHETLESADLVVAADEDPERLADARVMTKALGRLSETQREVLYLHDFAGCTFAEIGRIVGVSMFTAASRHRLAIRRLRSLMGVDHVA